MWWASSHPRRVHPGNRQPPARRTDRCRSRPSYHPGSSTQAHLVAVAVVEQRLHGGVAQDPSGARHRHRRGGVGESVPAGHGATAGSARHHLGVEVQRHQVAAFGGGGRVGMGDSMFGEVDQGVGAPCRQRLVEVGDHESFDRRHERFACFDRDSNGDLDRVTSRERMKAAFLERPRPRRPRRRPHRAGRRPRSVDMIGRSRQRDRQQVGLVAGVTMRVIARTFEYDNSPGHRRCQQRELGQRVGDTYLLAGSASSPTCQDSHAAHDAHSHTSHPRRRSNSATNANHDASAAVRLAAP